VKDKGINLSCTKKPIVVVSTNVRKDIL